MQKDIAIIGVGGIFPDAGSLDEFYNNLEKGRDSVQPLSDNRKVFSAIDQDPVYKPGGFLERVDLFDYKFFKISRAEAEGMDPQQRLLLELTCEAIHNAGYSLEAFKGSLTGVFLAANDSGYSAYLSNRDASSILGNLNAAIAGRIAYYFDLRGPAMMINTACSSSMLTVIEACNHLLLGHADCAIAGSIKIDNHFDRQDEELGFDTLESGNGKCKTFDQSADGIVGGEGGGVLILKLLDAAIRDRDHIHAVIKGYAVNQDGGRKVGITAPSPAAQTEMLERAWTHAGIDPRELSYIEAHGTGTKLGDPVEIKGLTDAFAKYTDKRHFCAVSSLKTNIGHLDSSAGIAGLIKVILSLRHKKLFPSLHFHNPNELIDFVNTAVYVNDKLADWMPACGKRIAGISSFGITGTNTHLVLEESPPLPAQEGNTDDGELLFKFSARTRSSLQRTIRRILHYASHTELSLADLSYTLNTGRDDYPYREAIVTGTDKKKWAAALHALLSDPHSAAVGREPGEEPPSSADLVLFFPGNSAPPEELVRHLLDTYPAFKEKWDECGLQEDLSVSDAVRLFAFQLAFYYLLRSWGIRCVNRIGMGVGNTVIATLSGKLSLLQGLAAARQAVLSTEAPDRDKLIAFLKKLKAPVCLELTPGAGFVSLLKDESLPDQRPLLPGLSLSGALNGMVLSMRSLIAALYRLNIDVEWTTLYRHAMPGTWTKVEAPGYALERTRTWYTDPLPLSGRSKENWFYDLDWIAAPLTAVTEIPSPALWLLVMDDKGIGEKLERHLSGQGRSVLKVYLGETCKQLSKYEFLIRPDQEQDYIFLRNSLDEQQLTKPAILHLGGCIGKANPSGPANGAFNTGLYPQFLLAKTFSESLSGGGYYAMVSLNGYEVIPGDPVADPGRSASSGLLRGLIGEYPSVHAKFIDIADSETITAETLLREIGSDEQYICAYRQGRRYIQALKRIEPRVGPEKKDTSLQSVFAENGVYLVTGGASGIGYEISKSILANTNVTLVIAGRTDPGASVPLPDKESAGMAEKAGNLERLAADGSNVQYIICDMGDGEQVRTLINGIIARYGKLDGIVHSAAAPGKKRIKNNSLAEFKEVLASRVEGTIALVEATQELNLGFLMIFSSLSAVLPALPRKSDYASGCVFADSYVRKCSKERKEIRVLHWCDWQETGMTYRVVDRPQEFSAGRSFLHLRSREGIAVFNYLLQEGYRNTMLLGNFQLAEDSDLEYLQDNKYFHWSPSGKMPVAETAGLVTEADLPLAEEGVTATLSTMARLELIWKEVLRIDVIKPGDDFFDLGGQSLNGYTVLKQIEKIFEVELEIEDLFDYPVFSQLSQYIDQLRSDQGKIVSYEHIPVLPLLDHYELSHAQKRIWLLYKAEGPGAAYNVPQVFVLKGMLDLEAFRDSLYALIERHEILRTTFITVGGEPRQVVQAAKHFAFTLRYQDLSGRQDREREARRQVREVVGQIFDLEKGPLFVASLYKLGDDRYAFVFNMHHIVSDGWSIDILLKDILSLYDALVNKNTQGYPAPLKLQYKDFAAWQNRLVKDEKTEVHRRYWLDKLSGEIPALSLPLDFPRPDKRNYAGAMYQTSLDNALTDRLRSLNRSQGTTLFILLQAIVKVLLFRLSGQEDLSIGIPVAGRVNEALNNQIGVYINNIVLRDRLRSGMSFAGFLQQVKKNTLEAFNHQIYPYDKLLEDLKIRYQKNRNPLYDVLMSMSNFNILEKSNLSTLSTLHQLVSEEEMEMEHVFSKLDLSFFLDERKEDISFKIEYRVDLFTPETIENMAAAFKTLAIRITEDPDVTLDELRTFLMSKEEMTERLAFEKYITREISEEF